MFDVMNSISIYFVQNQVGLHSQRTGQPGTQHTLTAARCKGP